NRPPWVTIIPSAPPGGTSTSALKWYDESRMNGASPFGVPVILPDQVNSVRPAARLGRGATTRVATEASSGRAWYFRASGPHKGSSSLSFAGFLAGAASSFVQSLVRSCDSCGGTAG